MEKEYRARIAALETKVDYLESELTHLDSLLRECGFPHGIATLKLTVQELIDEAYKSPRDFLEENFG